ncbi:MAG TPA: glycosyltransferase family 39 protein [Anaerolineales bacterium]|nr:glycosyltransferase family 39 protein [Anaerolineales bacterium]
MKFPGLFIKAVTPIVSMVLALAGVIQLRSQIWTVGTICLVLAVIGFVLSMRLLEQNPFSVEQLEDLRPILIPSILWVSIIDLLIISVIFVADNTKTSETDRVASLAWVCSIFLSLMVIWWGTIQQLFTNKFAVFNEKIRENRSELIALAFMLGMAFLLRTISLSAHPYPWSGDEASIGIEARRILNGEITNFFDTGWSSQPNWSFVPTALTEFIFGQNIFAVRLASALAGTLAVLFVYLTARVLFNPTIGLMAAAFLATLPYNVHFSRIGVSNIVDSLFSSMLFWLIAKALKDDDPRFYYSAGIVGGLCIYTYAGTRLALILAGIFFLFVGIRQRGYLVSHWKHLITFAFGVLLSMAPQAAFFARHPYIFLGRFGQEGIFLNGWLAQRAIQTGQSQLDILIDQFTRTTMVFVASSAPGNFFNSPEPYLTVLGSILFLLGMAYAMAHILETRYFMLLVWFWAVILFGGILTLNPPANTRMLMTSPPVAILMAVGLHKFLDYLQKFRLVPDRAIVPAIVSVLLIISYQNINFYMVKYRNNMYFADANGEFAMETGLMANDLRDVYALYFIGAPRIFSGFPTIPFLAPQYPRSDLKAEDIPTLTLQPDQKVAFFAIPENRPLLEEISQKFPGGERGLIYRKPRPNEILFEYYILAP